MADSFPLMPRPPAPWVQPDGQPTPAFYIFMTKVFKAVQTNSPFSLADLETLFFTQRPPSTGTDLGPLTKRVSDLENLTHTRRTPPVPSPVLTPPIIPEGRLTLVSGQPVMTSDQSGKSQIFYTPYNGSFIPIWDGANMTPQLFSELTLNLDTTNHLLNNAYDVFVWNNAGTISVGAGPAWNYNSTVSISIASPAVITWNNHGLTEGTTVAFTTTGALPTGITAGTYYVVGRAPGTNSFNIATNQTNAAAGTFINTSGSQSGTQTATNNWHSRGTGAGTTEIALKNGIWTNNNPITLTNGAGGGTPGIPKNAATYVGSFITTANGLTADQYRSAAASGGPTGGSVACLYNAYNRIRRSHRAQDSGGWSYTSSTWRAADNAINNRVWCFDGLAQSSVETAHQTFMFTTAANCQGAIGVNQNATQGTPTLISIGGVSGAFFLETLYVTETFYPVLGWSFYQAMEADVTNAGTVNFGGNATGGQSMQITAIFDH